MTRSFVIVWRQGLTSGQSVVWAASVLEAKAKFYQAMPGHGIVNVLLPALVPAESPPRQGCICLTDSDER